MQSLLVKNCDWVVTQDKNREVARDASIFIQDGEIKQIGKSVRSPADSEIDGRGRIALPGLINTHTHLSMTMFRGYADDMLLQDWLQKKIWPLEAKLTGEACYYGALLGSAEMSLSGTTSFVDMYFYMEDVARAVAKSGLRGFLSYGIIDLMDPAKARMEQEKARKFFDYIRGLGNPRIRFALGPHAPYTCSAETLLWAKEFAEKNDVIDHIHVAETRKEQADSQQQHGMRIVEYLDKIGALSKKMLAAHCAWLTKSEVALLAKAGVGVAHLGVGQGLVELGNGIIQPSLAAVGLPEEHHQLRAVGQGADGGGEGVLCFPCAVRLQHEGPRQFHVELCPGGVELHRLAHLLDAGVELALGHQHLALEEA